MKFSLSLLSLVPAVSRLLLVLISITNAAGQNTAGVVGWGFNNNGQANPQFGLSDVVDVSAGGGQSFALRANGAVVSWGFPLVPPVPLGLRDAAVLEAGRAHVLIIRSNGTVAAWGENTFGQSTIPAGLSNVVAVSGGTSHSLAATSDGNVVAWGGNSVGQSTVPPGLSNVIAVSAGGNDFTAYSVALKSDGTVVAWGDNRLRQTDVPPGLSNVVAISASPFVHTVALKSDGTVAVWGVGLLATNVPRGLSNVVAISAGSAFSLALRADGTLAGWGENSENVLNIPTSARNVSAIASGWFHNVAVVRSSAPRWPRISQQPLSQRTIAGQAVTLSVTATAAAPVSYRWQYRGRTIPGATSATLRLENPQGSDAGDYAVVVSADGLTVRSSPAFLKVLEPPKAASAKAAGIEDQEMVLILDGFDPSGLPLSARIVSVAEAGALYQYEFGKRGSPIETLPMVVTDPSRRIIFVPDPDLFGSDLPVAEFTIANEFAESAVATLVVDLEPINDAPVADSTFVTANEDAATPILLRARDVDGDALTYTVSQPRHGYLSGVPPNLLYRPLRDYTGSDTFTFSVHDGQASAAAAVSITVVPVNDPPQAVLQFFSATQYSGEPGSVAVLAPDNARVVVVFDGAASSDVEGDALQYFWFESGITTPFASGLRVTNVLELGTHAVILQVSDGESLASASVMVEVITPGEAVDEVLLKVAAAPGLRGKGRPLAASLKAAIASFDRGDVGAALNQMRAVENKIRAQMGRTDSSLAEEWIGAIRRIEDALGR